MSQTIDNRVAKKYTGINWDKAKNKWMIVVKHDGKNKFLGYTNDQEEGNAIRIDYINKYIKPILDERKDDRTLFENNICDFYLKLNNLEKTGERFNISASTVLEILKKNKINIRSNEKKIKNLDEVLFWYDLGESASLISSKIGLSVTTIIRKLKKEKRIIRQTKYDIDENIFQNINQEWKAHLLGLIMADGNVSKEMNNTSISLTEKDSYLLEDISKKVYGFINLKYYKPKSLTNGKYLSKPSLRINLCRKKICEDLQKYGCTPKKSLTLLWPEMLEDNMYKHFIRGFFDGDGYISKDGKLISIISSDVFCVGFQNFLKKYQIESKIKKVGKVSRIFIWKRTSVMNFKNFIYNDATIFLKRKRDRFLPDKEYLKNLHLLEQKPTR